MSSRLSRSGGTAIRKTLSLKYRSSRNNPFATISLRSRLVAAMIRTSTGLDCSPPTGRTSFCSITCNNFTCSARGSSPISSRKMVPPSASKNSPFLALSAPVNEPRVWPKNSLSTRLSGMAPQLTGIKWPSARGLCWCIKRATTPLPVPLSPVIKTVLLVVETLAAMCSISRMGGELQLKTSSLVPSTNLRSTRFSARSPRKSPTLVRRCSNSSLLRGLIM